MKATEQYFPVVLFIMLYKVVLTFESVDEIYWAVLSCGTVYYAVQCGSYFLAVLTNMSLCKNNHTMAQAFNKEKLSDLKWSTQNNFLKNIFPPQKKEEHQMTFNDPQCDNNIPCILGKFCK